MKFQARQENIVVQMAGDETMVYDLLADKAYLLNETSAFVWRMCDGTRDLADVAKALADKTKQSIGEDIVKLAIDGLRENNLFEDADNIKNYFTKTTRRKVIRQIGLATMVTLPAIFALTAPAAAHAASNQTNIAACQPCTQPSQCASGRCPATTYPGPPRICSNGTNNYTAVRPNFAFYNVYDSTYCSTAANKYCCAGNGATFTPPAAGSGGRGCVCKS